MLKLKQRIGDDKTYRIPLQWEGATFIPGTSWTLIYGVKEDPETDLDDASIFQKATGAGITHDGDDALVKVVPIDTQGDPDALPTPIPATPPGMYHWGIRAQHVTTGERRYVAEGTLELKWAVVRDDETAVPVFSSEEPYPASMVSAITNADPLDPITGSEEVASLDAGAIKKSTYDEIKTWVLAGTLTLIRTTAEGAPIDNDTDPIYIGRWCRVGDAAPFDWYQADTLTTWVMRYSGLSPVLFNADQSIFQKLVVVGTATNEHLEIQNL